MFNVERVLVLSPHTDDGEFGCGGTIVRLLSQNITVKYIAFSAAEESVPKGFKSDILRKEVKKATKALGIQPNNVFILNYPVRHFPKYRQEILEDMIKIQTDYKPQLILLPASTDTHQDHKTIYEEGFRAFKKNTILGYEIPWNNLDFTTSCFIQLTEREINTKINALQMYNSQQFRKYANGQYFRSLAYTRGIQINTNYAEAFEVIRYVL